MSTISSARNDDHDDDSTEDGAVPANPGPVPDEPEDVSEAGEGRLDAQAGGDRLDAETSDD